MKGTNIRQRDNQPWRKLAKHAKRSACCYPHPSKTGAGKCDVAECLGVYSNLASTEFAIVILEEVLRMSRHSWRSNSRDKESGGALGT